MIEISGPDNHNSLILDNYGNYVVDSTNSFFVECSTLRQALEAYCNKYHSSYRLYDGEFENYPGTESEKKYFYYKSHNPKLGEIIVDIHVERKGNNICLKQNLDFELLDGDIVRLGSLEC